MFLARYSLEQLLQVNVISWTESGSFLTQLLTCPDRLLLVTVIDCQPKGPRFNSLHSANKIWQLSFFRMCFAYCFIVYPAYTSLERSCLYIMCGGNLAATFVCCEKLQIWGVISDVSRVCFWYYTSVHHNIFLSVGKIFCFHRHSQIMQNKLAQLERCVTWKKYS